MQSKCIKNKIFARSEIGLSFMLTAFILSGCASNFNDTVSPGNVMQATASPQQANAATQENAAIQGNVAIVTKDSRKTSQKTGIELKLETIILEEIRRNWTEEVGDAYKLTESSEQKIVNRFLPEAKKQYELSYAAQNTKLAEVYSESNIETTITENESGRTVTKRKLFSKGEEKLDAARKNIETASVAVGKSLNNLSLVSQSGENTKTGKDIKNFDEPIHKILTAIHEQALKDIDEMFKPMFEERNQNSNRSNQVSQPNQFKF